jgi:predicted GIY-YIG superfamily endonuclease
VVLTEEFNSKFEAMAREKQLKNANQRTWIWEIINKKYNL